MKTLRIKNKIKKIYHFLFKSNKKIDKFIVGTLNENTRIDWLKNKLKAIPQGNRILDAGAGEQPYKVFCKHLNYVSQDFGNYNPNDLNSGLQVQNWKYGNLDIISDIANIPESDSSFDVIMCTEVLEHIVNPRDAIREFSRLLKKDGILILTAPFCSLTHFAPFHFYTGFSKYFYENELKINDFEIIEMIPNGNYFEYIAQELNRLESVTNKYCISQLNEKDKKNILSIKETLQKLSFEDKNSSELLCHGFHVLAKKI